LAYSPVLIVEDNIKSSEPTDGNYLEEFLDFCQYQRSLADNTIRSYRWDLKQWTTWLRDRDLDLIRVKIRDIDNFFISLRKEGRSVGSINRKIYCLKMFYRYLQRIEIIEKNPLDFMKNIRQPKHLPKYLTKEQQEALIQVLDDRYHPYKWGKWLKIRDRLMILLLLDTGVRISELCAIKKTDIDLEEGSIRIFGKGAKERFVILSERCIDLIKGVLQDDLREIDGFPLGKGKSKLDIFRSEILALLKNGSTQTCLARKYGTTEANLCRWLQKNREIKTYGSDEILFSNQQGRQLNTRHAFRLVQEIGERAGINGLYPHLLRHTYATNLLRKGGDLLLIREALGHSSVATTEIYSHLGQEEYKSKLRALIN
jgi:integrase/recombinase XerD